MTIEEFWITIDEARGSSAKLTDMPAQLIEILAARDEGEIVEFAEHLRNCRFLAHDANLWLAAVVIMGGCGDDKFSDFRLWLIAQGREVFEAALADPDSLVVLENFDGDHGRPILFRLGSVDQKAFCKRTAEDENDNAATTRFEQLHPIRKHPAIRNPELLNMKDEDAKALFPKLAARFPKGMPY